MKWSECVEKLIKEDDIKATFESSFIEDYGPSASEAKKTFSNNTKKSLFKRLGLVFKDIDKKGKRLVFNDINESEYQLFVSLLRYLPRSIDSVNINKKIDIYTRFKIDLWEHLPIDQRKLIIEKIEIVKNDGDTINKYIYASSDNDKEKIFESIKTRILYPEYYRLINNLCQLTDIFTMNYHQLIEVVGTDEFLNFEKDFDNLLRKYERRYCSENSIIRGYPRTEQEIDKAIESRGAPSLTNKDFCNLISDLIT